MDWPFSPDVIPTYTTVALLGLSVCARIDAALMLIYLVTYSPRTEFSTL